MSFSRSERTIHELPTPEALPGRAFLLPSSRKTRTEADSPAAGLVGSAAVAPLLANSTSRKAAATILFIRCALQYFPKTPDAPIFWVQSAASLHKFSGCISSSYYAGSYGAYAALRHIDGL
jgi:hypothetical protein